MNKKKIIFTLLISVASLAAIIGLVIYLFFPKLYTDPNTIHDYNLCELTGYPTTPADNGGKTCTLPNGNKFQSNGG